MFTINFVTVIFSICAVFLMETKQQSIVNASPVNDCLNTMCGNGYTLDLKTCLCIDNEPMNDSSNSVRDRRLSDKLLVSKLIRDDEFVMQTFSDRCRNNEQWNGRECIPLISLCPGGYHWNGHVCVIQVLTETVALIPSAPDTRCALNAKINDQSRNLDSDSYQQLPMTVMPTYSTSPMCPFGFIWSDDDKCIRNPPTCPNQYYFHENLCHLTVSSTSKNNQTTENSAQTSTDNDQNHKNCCIIRSPRLCRRKIHNRKEQWQCYHRQNRLCDDFCTKPNLYLRPKKTMFVEPLLIIPPLPRRLQKFMLNSPFRESNIGKQSYCNSFCR